MTPLEFAVVLLATPPGQDVHGFVVQDDAGACYAAGNFIGRHEKRPFRDV